MNLHERIRCEHGQESVKLVRDYEKSARKIAGFRNHLRFNLHCIWVIGYSKFVWGRG